ncbi:MAG TPA: hypothetical protein VGR35_09430 [Tepidisphaeraceae bacterium]|nr:hypothetical protein [Tepidisphaeraceae bacterium]
MPPWRAGRPTTNVNSGARAKYHLYDITFSMPPGSVVPGESTVDAAYWFNFLAKYVTKAKGGTADPDFQSQATFQETVVWGCPAFQKYPDNGIRAEWQPGFVGYSWNPHPSFTATNPAAGVRRPADTFRNNEQIDRCGVISTDDFATFQNRWFRITQYTRPAERALIADSVGWILEANAVPASGAIPGQKLHYARPEFANPGGTGQTTFDWYRHGRVPPVESTVNGGYFRSEGGKVSYNILYLDGHVVRSIDRRDAYRCTRMRFPQ